jgi:hypothetical protein
MKNQQKTIEGKIIMKLKKRSIVNNLIARLSLQTRQIKGRKRNKKAK